MTDKEFLALVSLLDDNDEVIREEIEKKFLSMGESIIPRLENEWERNTQPIVQERISEIIEDIQAQSILEKMRHWRMIGAKDLLEGWFIVSQYQYPGIELDIFRNKINRLVNMIWLEMTYSSTYSDRILAMNRILYDIEKYHPQQKNPAEPDTYFLNRLFERKVGNPFSMGILYLILSRKLELSISAVVLPNYLALHYSDSRNHFYIDAFNKGAFFNKNHLEDYIKESGFENNASYYEPATNRQIISALLKSLLESYHHIGKNNKEKTIKELLKIVG